MQASSDTENASTESLPEELNALIDDLRDQIRELRGEVEGLGPKREYDALLTRSEAADWLRISTRTLDDMADAGEIDPVRVRGRVLYHPETLEEYVRSRLADGR